MSPDPTLSEITLHQASQETTKIARAASIISLGNVISRILGLVRDMLKSEYFGAGSAVDAYTIATIVPTMMYDLLIGGMVNSALVPVFSEYAARDREELWGLVSIILSLAVAILTTFVLVVELFAPQVAFLLSSGASSEVLALATHLLRITVPAVLFLSLSGVITGLLYALKRFTYPAFTTAIFNAGIVALVLLFHSQLGIASMAIGLLVGSLLQMILQLPGLYDTRLRFNLNLMHPGLRRAVTLFAPVVLGLLVDILIGRPITYNLASQTGEGGISWMGYATALREMPQGLVAAAVSFAVLPTLSAHAVGERTGNNNEPFKVTLAQGLRLVIVLILPATVGLFILARPTIDLLLEHGDFIAADTQVTTRALELYLLGLPFAAIDLLLVFSFYARQDTLTPSLIGVFTIITHLIVAVMLMPPLGLYSLMIADSFKHLLHMLISAVILWRRIGGLARHGLSRTLVLTIAGVTVMGVVTYGARLGMGRLLAGDGLLTELLLVLVPAMSGAGVYLGLITVLGVEEIHLLWSAIRRRLLA